MIRPPPGIVWVFLLGAALPVTGDIAAAQGSEVPLANWQHTSWTGSAGPPMPGSHFLLGSPDGYIWVSAENCLLRFDGLRFTVFDSTRVPVLRSKASGEFIPILLDRRGVMWIAGPDGERITYQDGKFASALKLESGSGPVGEDDRGLIWMVGGKPQRYEQGRMQPIPLPAAVPTADMWSFISDTAGGFWVGSRGHGIWHVSRTGEARQHGTGEMRPLIQGRDGTIWALGMALKGTAHLEGDRWVPLLIPSDSVPVFGRFAVEDREGAIWFQTNAQGVVRYRKGIVEAFTPRHGLSDRRLSDVYVDPAGTVWVSTDAGLDRLRPALFSPLDPAHRIADGIGAAFAPDTGGGMWVTDDDASAIMLIDGGILGAGNRPLTTKAFLVGDGATLSLLGASRRGGVWVQPFAGDLLHLMPDGSRQTFGARQGVPRARFNGSIETRDGTVWLEQGDGFGRLRNGRYRPVTIGDSAVTANAYVEDPQGRLWLAWNDQPNLAVFQGDSLVDSVRVPTPHVDFLSLEGSDTVWAASEYGIVRIIDHNAVKVSLPLSLGRILVGNLSIAAAQGWLWVASSAGIARVSLADLHRAADGDSVRLSPVVFDPLDGFAAPRTARMTWRAILQGGDGRVWINTADGLAVANPAEPAATGVPRVMIEEIRVDGVKLADEGRSPVRPGRLDVYFTATGLKLPERARLQYRLDGADKAWVEASIPRVATYNHLEAGNYVFRVRARDADGNPAGEEMIRRLRVPPAWNQTLWFRGAVVLLIGALGAAAAILVQRQRHFLSQKALRGQYEATLTERARMAQELHDTLLQGIAGVSMQLKAAERALPDQPDVAAETLIHVQHLTRETLREARERVLDLQEPELGKEDLADVLKSSAEGLIATTGIEFSLLTRGDRRRLPRMVEVAAIRIGREALANAVRHAEARHIEVALGFEAAALCLEIRDDGRGFAPEQGERARQQGHLGLTGMRNRAAQAGGTCEVRSQPDEGTVIIVELPVKVSRRTD